MIASVSVLARPLEPGSAEEAVQHAIAAGVAKIAAHEPGVRAGEDPEELHQERVATRRLRSDLRTFRSLVDPEWAARLRQELSWLADRLGAVRDTDVLLGHLSTDVLTLDAGDRAEADILLHLLTVQRSEARSALLRYLSGDRYRVLRTDLGSAAAAPAFIGSAGPARRVVPGLVRGPWKHLETAVSRAGRHPSDDSLHEIRIRAKRVRYAVEAVTPVVGKPAARLAGAVSAMQDELGEFHDAVIAEDWLRMRGSEAPMVAGQLIAVQRAKAQVGRERWRARWQEASAKKLRDWMT